MRRRIRQTTPAVIALTLLALTGCTAPGAPTREVATAGSSSALRDSLLYTCAMHRAVKAAGPGSCPQCEMPLVTVAALREPTEYAVTIERLPEAARSGENVQLRFLFFHPKTGAQIKDFNIFHEMRFHLFIVRHDLKHYQHIHPKQQDDGSFTIETMLPEPGRYEIFCDIFPVGGVPRVVHQSLDTTDSPGTDRPAPARLDPDKSLVKAVDGIRFELTLQPPQPVAGQPTLLSYFLVNEETGLPVTDLQPYLGAWGHTVSLREEATDFLHSHASKAVRPDAGRGRSPTDPKMTFNAVFARPGPHRIWSQVQRNNRVVTVSFTLSVSRLDRLAKWDGAEWSTLAGSPTTEMDGTPRALAASGSDIYVGGDFTRVDGVRASRIARWDGRRWSSLGAGVNGTVWAIAVSGGDVYAGGEFTEAGGKRAGGIARWDGREWSPLRQGIRGCRDPFERPTVYALAARGREVHAGGRFTRAGRVAANGIALWDGRGWAALGEGVETGIYDGVVRALALQGEDLYAGGQFTKAGGVDVHNVAKWNGRGWSALGGGIRGHLEQVLAIGVSGRDVYVGGLFGSADGMTAANLAIWNGEDWSAADVRADEGVWSMAVSGRSVYAGGASFRLPGGMAARGVVKREGGAWSALGSGLGADMYSGPVMAIVPSGDVLYVGGEAFSVPDPISLAPDRAASQR